MRNDGDVFQYVCCWVAVHVALPSAYALIGCDLPCTVRNQELAAALGGGARQVQQSTQLAGAAQISVVRLEAELSRARQRSEASANAEKTLRASLNSLQEEAALSSKECDEAQAARVAAERSLVSVKRQLDEVQVWSDRGNIRSRRD